MFCPGRRCGWAAAAVGAVAKAGLTAKIRSAPSSACAMSWPGVVDLLEALELPGAPDPALGRDRRHVRREVLEVEEADLVAVLRPVERDRTATVAGAQHRDLHQRGSRTTSSTLRSLRVPDLEPPPAEPSTPESCGSLNASVRASDASCAGVNALAGPGAGAATGAAESSSVPNSDSVPSSVVHDLDQPALLRPVDVRRGVDLPEPVAALAAEEAHAVRVRVAGHVADHVRVAPRTAPRRSSCPSRRGGSASSVRGSRSQPGSSAGWHAPASSSARALSIVSIVWWPNATTSWWRLRAERELALEPAVLRVVEVAVLPAALADGVERDESQAALRRPGVVARRAARGGRAASSACSAKPCLRLPLMSLRYSTLETMWRSGSGATERPLASNWAMKVGSPKAANSSSADLPW